MGRALRAIAMTANAMAGDREKALDAGMNDHVAKPIDVKELFGVLSNFIESKAQGLISEEKKPSVEEDQIPELEESNLFISRSSKDFGRVRPIQFKSSKKLSTKMI